MFLEITTYSTEIKPVYKLIYVQKEINKILSWRPWSLEVKNKLAWGKILSVAAGAYQKVMRRQMS